jgi:hypothetical protein
MESLSEPFRVMANFLTRAPEQSPAAVPAGTAWKTIVKTYLSPEHYDHVECGCPQLLKAVAVGATLAWATLSLQSISCIHV